MASRAPRGATASSRSTGGTRVTESYTVDKIPVWARVMDVPLNRHGDLLKNMATTLDRLKAAAEHSTPAVDSA